MAIATVLLVAAIGSASAVTVINSCNFNANTAGEEYVLGQNLTCSGSEHGIKIGADNIVINGYNETDGKYYWIDGNITNCDTFWSGVRDRDGHDNVVIKNLEIKNFCHGIWLVGDSSCSADVLNENYTIENCIIHDNGIGTGTDMYTHGIKLHCVCDSTITKNEIYNQTGTGAACEAGGDGIFLKGPKAWGNDITCNNIHNNRKAGIFVKMKPKHNNFSYNNVWENGQPNAGTTGGIIFRCKMSDMNDVLYNNVSNNYGEGIYIGGCGNNIRYNTVINNTHYGIQFDRCSETGWGSQCIAEGHSTKNTIYNNTFCSSGTTDIRVEATCQGNASGDENTCDSCNNYNDEGETCCTYTCANLVSVYYDFDKDDYYSKDPEDCSCGICGGKGTCACCNPGLFNSSGAGQHCVGGVCVLAPGTDTNDCEAEETIDYYCDTDGDGYISSTPTGSCPPGEIPPGCQATPGDDCDDTNPDVNPGAAENCTDGIDNDCDGLIDGNDPDCYPNKVYFVPEDVRVPGYCDTTTVGVWTDTNVSIASGYIVFEYTQCCADVTNFQFNTTNWQHPDCAWFDDLGRVRIKFLNITANGPGPVHLGDLTIHCCNESSYCVTDMVWNVSYPSYLEDDMGNEITPVNWKDGTFRCNIPDLVITSAWGEGNDTHYTVSYAIKNVGKAPASASYANLSVDGSQVETMRMPALGPGEERTYSFSTVIAITDETDLIKVCADYNDTVVELDETNNCKKQFYPAGVELAIEFSPAHNITVAPGDQFVANVTIDARPGVEVYGAEYDLWFDPAVVHAEWQNEGGFLNKDGNSTNVYNAKIDNSIGKIEFAITRIGTSVGVSGNGTLAKIGFTALEQQGACTNLTFDNVKVSDADADKIEPVDLVNGSVCITANERPVPIGKSLFRYNNVGEKYLSKAYFSGSDSFDPDGSITYYRWAFGDGEYGTGETIDHIYDSWNWNDSTDTYEPFNASLTVEDDGTPILDDTTYFPVNVSIAGDAKPDGIVDIFDAVIVGLEWDNTANFNGSLYWWNNPRGDQADLNNDRVVDIFDAVIVGANWDHTAWR